MLQFEFYLIMCDLYFITTIVTNNIENKKILVKIVWISQISATLSVMISHVVRLVSFCFTFTVLSVV